MMFYLTALFYGLIILFSISFVFHLIVFGLSKRLIDVLTSVILSQWILALLLIVQGLTYTFKPFLTLLLLFFMSLTLRKRIREKLRKVESLEIKAFDLTVTIFFLVFMLFLLKNAFTRPFSSDTFRVYMPLARIIVQENGIPAFHLQNNMNYMFTVFPLLPSLIAFLFSFSNSFFEWITVGLPLFYSTLTFFVLWMWGKEKRGLSLSLTITLCYLTSTTLVLNSTRVLVEPIILFYCTTSLYFLFKWMDKPQKVYLILALLSLSLFSLTKFTGVVFTGLLILVSIVRKREYTIREGVTLTFVAFTPVFLWSAWTVYNYGEPFFPNLSDYLRFLGYTVYKYTPTLTCRDYAYELYSALGYSYGLYSARDFTLALINEYPFLLLLVAYFLTHIKDSRSLFILLCIVFFSALNVHFLWPETRHILCLMGAAIFYAGEGLLLVYNIVAPTFLKKTKLLLAVSYVAFWHILVISYLRGDYPSLWWKNLLYLLLILLVVKVISEKSESLRKIELKFPKSLQYALILSVPIIFFVVAAPGNFPWEVDFEGTLNFIKPFFSPFSLDPMPYYSSSEWHVLDYLNKTERNRDVIITGMNSHVLVWYGNYTLLPLRLPGFLNLNKGDFDYTEDSEFYHDRLKVLGVDYVYASGEWSEVDCISHFFEEVNSDREHFNLVFIEDNQRLWKVM